MVCREVLLVECLMVHRESHRQVIRLLVSVRKGIRLQGKCLGIRRRVDLVMGKNRR